MTDFEYFLANVYSWQIIMLVELAISIVKS